MSYTERIWWISSLDKNPKTVFLEISIPYVGLPFTEEITYIQSIFHFLGALCKWVMLVHYILLLFYITLLQALYIIGHIDLCCVIYHFLISFR